MLGDGGVSARGTGVEKRVKKAHVTSIDSYPDEA